MNAKRITIPKCAMLIVPLSFSSFLGAVDLEATRTLDAGSKAHVSNGRTMARSSVMASVHAYQSLALTPQKYFLEDEPRTADSAYLSRTGRSSLLVGYGITDRIEINVGISGSYENQSQKTKQSLFDAPQNEGEALGEKRDNSTYAYSGASLLVKLNLIDNDGFAWSFAPFVSEGLGQKVAMQLTRAKRSHGGWKSIMTLGNEHAVNFTLDLGFHYQTPEDVGDIRVRNSLFANTALNIPINHVFGLTLSTGSNRLMIADRAKQQPGTSYKYESLWAHAFGGGVSFSGDNFTYNLFFGGSPSDQRGLGFGKSHAGMSIDIPIGAYSSKNSKAYNRIAENESTPKSSSSTVELFDKEETLKEYPEMNGATSYTGGLGYGGGDEVDFAAIEKKVTGLNAKSGQKDINEYEKELAELKKAEELAKKNETRYKKQNERQIRQKQLKELAIRRKKINDMRAKVKRDQENDRLGITAEDANWRGLE